MGKGGEGCVFGGRQIGRDGAPLAGDGARVVVKDVFSRSRSGHLPLLQLLQQNPEAHLAVPLKVYRCPRRQIHEVYRMAVHGDLHGLLERTCGGQPEGVALPEREVAWYTWDLVRGLHHLHGLGYAHMDIKPENVLLFPRNSLEEEGAGAPPLKAVLADFGLARRLDASLRPRPSNRDPMNLMPPEAKSPLRPSFSPVAADVWGLGATVVLMLTGFGVWIPPGTRDIRFQGDLSAMVSEECMGFLSACLAWNPRMRLFPEELTRLPFVGRFSTKQAGAAGAGGAAAAASNDRSSTATAATANAGAGSGPQPMDSSHRTPARAVNMDHLAQTQVLASGAASPAAVDGSSNEAVPMAAADAMSDVEAPNSSREAPSKPSSRGDGVGDEAARSDCASVVTVEELEQCSADDLPMDGEAGARENPAESSTDGRSDGLRIAAPLTMANEGNMGDSRFVQRKIVFDEQEEAASSPRRQPLLCAGHSRKLTTEADAAHAHLGQSRGSRSLLRRPHLRGAATA